MAREQDKEREEKGWDGRKEGGKEMERKGDKSVERGAGEKEVDVWGGRLEKKNR